MIIEFYDESGGFGFIEVEKEDFILSKIKDLTEEYKKSDEEGYNIDDLYSYLKEHGIKFKILPTEADERIYF